MTISSFVHYHTLCKSKMSMTDRVELWHNYMLAALVTARSLRCPTMLVAYERWLGGNQTRDASPTPSGAQRPLSAAQSQLDELVTFLRCAGIPLPKRPPYNSLNRLIQPSLHHHHEEESTTPSLPPAVACLWDELRSSRALQWAWDDEAGRFREPPCVGGRAPSTPSSSRATHASSWTDWLQMTIHHNF